MYPTNIWVTRSSKINHRRRLTSSLKHENDDWLAYDGSNEVAVGQRFRQAFQSRSLKLLNISV